MVCQFVPAATACEGEAEQDEKIEQLAHVTKLLHVQQDMDLKLEKMLILGLCAHPAAPIWVTTPLKSQNDTFLKVCRSFGMEL